MIYPKHTNRLLSNTRLSPRSGTYQPGSAMILVYLYYTIPRMKKILAFLFSIFVFATNISAQQATLQEGLALKYLVRLPAQRSAHPPVIILLHGYGSDEKDLFELRNLFPENYLIIAARAPYTLPHGGYQW